MSMSAWHSLNSPISYIMVTINMQLTTCCQGFEVGSGKTSDA